MKGLIIGVDPGAKTAIAILDLNKNLLKLHSKKDLSEEKVIKTISEYGLPAILACDVNPAPSFVENIAAKTNSNLIVPSEDMKVKKKNEIVYDFLEKIPKDNHKRDALASAIKAYNRYSNQINELESILEERKIKGRKKEKYIIFSLKHPRKNVLKRIEKARK